MDRVRQLVIIPSSRSNGQTQSREVKFGPAPAPAAAKAMELSASIGGSLAMAAPTGVGSPKMTYQTCANGLPCRHQFAHGLTFLAGSMMFKKQSSQRCLQDFRCRTNRKVCRPLQAVSPLQCTEIPMQPSVSFKDFCVSVSTEENRVIKIQINVAATMTESTFEKVLKKIVAAAQPLPGFRRMKGGKTPEIPKEVALHLVGPSKVKKEAIKKIINCTVAEYVEKEGLNASKNLKVQQSYEELEAAFEPGKEFCFDAVIHLQ